MRVNDGLGLAEGNRIPRLSNFQTEHLSRRTRADDRDALRTGPSRQNSEVWAYGFQMRSPEGLPAQAGRTLVGKRNAPSVLGAEGDTSLVLEAAQHQAGVLPSEAEGVG
jgi:hypothetical protein